MPEQYQIGGGSSDTPDPGREYKGGIDLGKLCLGWLEDWNGTTGQTGHEDGAAMIVKGQQVGVADVNFLLLDERLKSHSRYQYVPWFMNMAYKHAVKNEVVVFDMQKELIGDRVWSIGNRFDRVFVNKGHISRNFGEHAGGIMINAGYVGSEICNMGGCGIFINVGRVDGEFNTPADCPVINAGTTKWGVADRQSHISSHILIDAHQPIYDLEGERSIGYAIYAGGYNTRHHPNVPPTPSLTAYLDTLIDCAKNDPAKIPKEFGAAAEVKLRLKLEIETAQATYRKKLSELFRRKP